MKTKKFSKKAKEEKPDSLRGHEEVGVAVGEVADGQRDGAEQEEVHGVLFVFVLEKEEVEKERVRPEERRFDETTSKRKKKKELRDSF